jgi:thiopeptide-type bacteriocin biosynthesis protein
MRCEGKCVGIDEKPVTVDDMNLSRASRHDQLHLADDIELEVDYSDDTRFGSLTSGRLLSGIRMRCRPITEHWHRYQGTATVAKSDVLFEAVIAGALGELFSRPQQLRQEVLYPAESAVRPAALVVSRERQEILRAPLSRSLTTELARWIGDWTRSAVPPRAGEARVLYEQLAGVAAFTHESSPPDLEESDCQFIGHAAVAVGNSTRGRVLIDPYLLPRSRSFPDNYQPIVPSQLSNVSAVCITHSHPDHFALGALLKFGAGTRIIVPRVPRESALSIGMAYRLNELGFERVEEVGWGEELEIPGGRILALPLFGEQPTTGPRLHPEVRNHGNTYLVELNSKRYLTVADSGKDSEGDTLALAEKLLPEVGQLDVLFGGYRAFPIYPIEYISSSVSQYALFVPKRYLLRRQRIMLDADELVDLAECWKARHLIPYACGGAPWYSQRGLGPGLDDERQRNRGDLGPEAVLHAARFRTGTSEEPNGSPTLVTVLRPGDGFDVGTNSLRVIRREPHAWPFARRRRAVTPKTEVDSIGLDQDEAWLQFNLTMNEASEATWADDAWRVFRRMAPIIGKLKSTGRCRSFFFQRKAPGLRIRFELGPGTLNPIGEVRYELERARRIGAIQHYAEAVYEPELRMFGGARAMDAVHDYFDADTALFLQWLSLARSSMVYPVLERTSWLGLVADDLVVSCLGEQGECWDVYASLLERHPGVDADGSARRLPKTIEFASRGEHDLFVQYRAANRRLAGEIDSLWNKGNLQVGRRLLVANVVQFQFNRYLATAREQQAILHRLLVTRPRAEANLRQV